MKEYILCAAILRKFPRDVAPYWEGTNDICDIEIGYRHHDIYQRFGNELSRDPYGQGFYTSKGRFVGRYEGMKIAIEAGQVVESRGLISKESEEKLAEMDTMFVNLREDTSPKQPYQDKYYPLFSEDLY